MLSKTIYGDELQSLADVINSGLPILSSASTASSIFGDTNDTTFKMLRSKIQITHIASIDQAAFFRNTCSIERYSDVRIIILVYYI